MSMYYVYINGKRSVKKYTYDEALSLVQLLKKTFAGLDVMLVEEDIQINKNKKEKR